MSWTPSDKEVAALTAADAQVRYEYFVKHVADEESAWSLRGEGGWGLTADESGRELVPVWPHARYAADCISGEWAALVPESIQLSAWLERWTPGMIKDGRHVAVFPTATGKAVSVPPERLRDDLSREQSSYE